MTYAVALNLESGMVFAADTRTNAGVDNISQFRKLHCWERAGDRVVVLLTAGNLAVTQSVVSLLDEQIAAAEPGTPNLLTVASMYRVARLVGAAVRDIRDVDGAALEASNGFTASFILGGQIGNEPPRLFQIYAEGNFIESTVDTPYFQIGEHKYGKPILDRVTHSDMGLGEAAKLMLLSFDSTMRSNLSVGMPIDLLVYERDALAARPLHRLDRDNEYFHRLSKAWSDALRSAVERMEAFEV